MKISIKKGLRKIIKSNWIMTIFVTTFGVLLAFYLNNLNIKQKIEKIKIKAIENIKTELSNNEEKLNDSDINNQLLVFIGNINDYMMIFLMNLKLQARL